MDEEKKNDLEDLKRRINDINDDIIKLNQIQREREEKYESECYEIKKMLDAGLFNNEENFNILQEMMFELKMKTMDLGYDIEEAKTALNKQIEELEEKQLEMEEEENAREN